MVVVMVERGRRKVDELTHLSLYSHHPPPLIHSCCYDLFFVISTAVRGVFVKVSVYHGSVLQFCA